MPLKNKNAQLFDPVLPGEQWFCYWKTSASLWEGRILGAPPHEVIFVPLYWGFHAEAPESWDFGRLHPERDLLRLTELLERRNGKFCWLLPLTPAPFLPNGGIPSVAARTLALSFNGVHQAVFDQEEKLNKMYSYFEPRVFQSFVDFLKAFGKFLGENKIKAPVWGGEFYFQEAERNISYLEDSSVAFEQGFSRYLKQNYQEGVDLSHPSDEFSLKQKFTREVEDLFKSTAEAALAPFWMGVQGITVLGGSPTETIQRSLSGGMSQLSFVGQLLGHFTHGRWISSCLLGPREKGEILSQVLSEHFGPQEIERRYHYQIQSGKLTNEWRPFGVVDLFDGGQNLFKGSGLISYLEKHFPWAYSINKELSFTTDWIEENQHKVKFFHGATLDRARFGQMLKLFMMGQRVVLDKSALSTELDRRLQVFLLENNLKVQAVNFKTPVTLTELGEGKFLTFDGSRLDEMTGKEFWPHLFRYFNLNHLDVGLEDEVFSLWRIRGTTSCELNFLDVRRLNLYNPTSYRKHVTIQTKGGFAFMKMIDPSKAQARSVTGGVEVELLPNGRIGLDFGHYEET